MVYDVIVKIFDKYENEGVNPLDKIEEVLGELKLKNNLHKRKFISNVYKKYKGEEYNKYLDTVLLFNDTKKVFWFDAKETVRIKIKRDDNFNLDSTQMAKYMCKKMRYKHTEANFYLMKNIYLKAIGEEYDKNIDRFLK